MLKIAARHSDKKLSPSEDWEATCVREERIEGAWWREYAEDKKHALQWEGKMLSETLNEWLVLGDVRPTVRMKTPSNIALSLELAGAASNKSDVLGLFGGLAVQLTFAASQTDGFAVCSTCAGPYFPKRRPSPTRNNYCPICRKNGSRNRAVMNNWRRKTARK